MKKLLWSPPKDRINNSNLKKFIEFVKLENCNDFKTLWKWSISNPEKFWSKFWDFSEIIGEKGNQILKMDNIFYKSKFFFDSKLNYSENILKKKI
tara:strand:- start:461 stop:745 length:285 start_codon:yes stop_codon:yes gene_type:complete